MRCTRRETLYESGNRRTLPRVQPRVNKYCTSSKKMKTAFERTIVETRQQGKSTIGPDLTHCSALSYSRPNDSLSATARRLKRHRHSSQQQYRHPDSVRERLLGSSEAFRFAGRLACWKNFDARAFDIELCWRRKFCAVAGVALCTGGVHICVGWVRSPACKIISTTVALPASSSVHCALGYLLLDCCELPLYHHRGGWRRTAHVAVAHPVRMDDAHSRFTG